MSRRKDANAPSEANYTTKSGLRKSVKIIPRNSHQEEYLEYLMSDEKMIVIANGPAGTGKTQLAMLAAIKFFSEKKVSKIMMVRPNIGVDDNEIGFLPGDIWEKMLPYAKPLLDVLLEYYSQKDIDKMVEDGRIEFAPLLYMRGRNIKHAFVILDESQNTTISECKAILTRLCEGSKLVMTGDNDQTDRKNNENGLLFINKALDNGYVSKYIGSVEFEFNDIERHPVVGDILRMFEKYGK